MCVRYFTNMARGKGKKPKNLEPEPEVEVETEDNLNEVAVREDTQHNENIPLPCQKHC